MIVPSSSQAVISRQSGNDSRSAIRLWYLVAVSGLGRPANTPCPSCSTGEVLPCISSRARTTLPPYTWAID